MIDTHTHLTLNAFDDDREEIVENFEDDDLESLIEVGFDLESSQKAVNFAKTHLNVYASVGVHPHNVLNIKEGWEESIEAFLNDEKVVALGEIGLDYYRDLSPRDLQKKYFTRQLEIASKKHIPVILHVRDAYSDVYGIVKDFSVSAVVHSFNGGKDDLKKFLDLGFYIGVGGIATYKKNAELRETISFAPLNRIVIETDCPYLAPQPVRGKRNEPKYVRFAIETLSLIFKAPFKEIEMITSANAKSLFTLLIPS